MNSAFSAQNRKRLMKKLQGGLVVLSAYDAMQWSGDMATPFRQEANFYYLTGIAEPSWWVIIEGLNAKTYLVRPTQSEQEVLFEGTFSDNSAKNQSGAQEVIARQAGFDALRQLARQHHVVYTYDLPAPVSPPSFLINPALKNMTQLLQRHYMHVRSCHQELAELRAIKQPVEVSAIKKAVSLSVQAHQYVRENIDSFRYEYEIEAALFHHIREAGADGWAYEPIVASRENACTLHYAKNNARLHKGSHILLDAAARYKGYSADITRTLAYGEVSPRSKQIHATVRQAQQAIIRLLKPTLSAHDLQAQSDAMMKQALLEVGLIHTLDDPAWRTYYPHAIGHAVGLNTHDPLGFQQLKPGMILTIEPGIYIKKERLGVRIEDTVLITKTGSINLSKKLPHTD